MTYLIADSGSTKTDWSLMRDGKRVLQVKTPGINPVHHSEEQMEQGIRATLLPRLDGRGPDDVRFYGAGCATPALKAKVRGVLQRCLRPRGTVEVQSDMTGAARGLLGRRKGIACILGTGSNSCLWDGGRIVMNVPPLGYLLGDEGSGAHLGRRLVNGLMKGSIKGGLREVFLERYALTTDSLLERVYRQPEPNRFLASLAPFLLEHRDDPQMEQLMTDCFDEFIRHNLLAYPDFDRQPVCFTGSVAAHFSPYLTQAAMRAGLQVGTVTASPMEGLIKFHEEKNK